jgi:hypothetical protein
MLLKSTINRLQTGVKLFVKSELQPKSPRVMLSGGTRQVDRDDGDLSHHHIGSFIPMKPWRLPTAFEQLILNSDSALLARTEFDLGNSIGIIHIPDSIRKPLENILDRSRNSSQICFEEHESAIQYINNNYDRILNSIEPFCRSDRNLESLRLHTAQPGSITLTQNNAPKTPDRPYIGLHLDHIDRAPLRLRHRSRNRICINLGVEDRYFLFINLTMINMFAALGLSDPEDIYRHYRAVSLGDEFMQSCPDYPVVRLTIAPGEAYIAPTDNIIHDATSEGKKYTDISLHLMGYFQA